MQKCYEFEIDVIVKVFIFNTLTTIITLESQSYTSCNYVDLKRTFIKMVPSQTNKNWGLTSHNDTHNSDIVSQNVLPQVVDIQSEVFYLHVHSDIVLSVCNC